MKCLECVEGGIALDSADHGGVLAILLVLPELDELVPRLARGSDKGLQALHRVVEVDETNLALVSIFVLVQDNAGQLPDTREDVDELCFGLLGHAKLGLVKVCVLGGPPRHEA